MDSHDQAAAQLLHAVRNVLSQVAEPSKVLKTILGQAVSQTGADRGLFAEITRSGRISYRVLYRFDKSELDEKVSRFSRNVFSQAMASGKPVRVENAMDPPQGPISVSLPSPSAPDSPRALTVARKASVPLASNPPNPPLPREGASRTRPPANNRISLA